MLFVIDDLAGLFACLLILMLIFRQTGNDGLAG